MNAAPKMSGVQAGGRRKSHRRHSRKAAHKPRHSRKAVHRRK